MAVTTVEVADHMLVASVAGRGGTAGADIQDTQITQHVSMVGANSVELTSTIHAVNLPGGETLQLILEQSNDQFNWFQVSPTTPPSPPHPTEPFSATATGLPYLFDNNIGMAWVRVVFLLDSAGARPWNGNATVSCTLTTSLK